MTTALMPLDPASTPQHVNRVLGIRASLMPSEIAAGRKARRVRVGIVGAVILVLALVGAGYGFALHQKSVADDGSAAVADEVNKARSARGKFSAVTKVIGENDTLTANLKTLLADDLRWASLMDTVRSVGLPIDVKITSISGSLTTQSAVAAAAVNLPSTSKLASVVNLNISGSAPDKETVARYVDTLGQQPSFANTYFSTTTDSTDNDKKVVSFTMSADITTDALCGRYGKRDCPNGGN
jgi:hypothetical protein